MKTCKDCIHRDVCEARRIGGDCGAETCDHFDSESQYKQTLLLIYAAFVATTNKRRSEAKTATMRGDPARSIELLRSAEDADLAASRVRVFCRKIGFDPKTELEERRNHESI